MSVSPLTINLMLACYVSPDPKQQFEPQQWDSSAARDNRNWLRGKGLIDDDYKATERGKAWVERILATKLPVQIWVGPDDALAAPEAGT